MLRKPTDPLDPANRRISVIVQYLEQSHQVAPKETAPAAESAAKPDVASKKE
jgi:hypothetical protein